MGGLGVGGWGGWSIKVSSLKSDSPLGYYTHSCTLHPSLHVNIDKSAILLKGNWNPRLQVVLRATNLPIQRDYKYLGIKIGHVTHDQSYRAAIQKGMAKALTMQKWALSPPERVALLKLWVLPLLVHVAKVVFPSDRVVNSLTSIYKTVLKTKFLGYHPRHPSP